MHGRDEVREWIGRTMGSFPGSHMVAISSLWSVIDEPTGRVIMQLDNPMRDPGDGTVIGETNIYNPLRFVQATLKWCRKAAELGTLDEDGARFLEQYGGAQ